MEQTPKTQEVFREIMAGRDLELLVRALARNAAREAKAHPHVDSVHRLGEQQDAP